MPLREHSLITRLRLHMADPCKKSEVSSVSRCGPVSVCLSERQDITGLNCIKGAQGKVIVDDKGIKNSWKEYMEKLMNEENEWNHKISAEVKEGPAD